MTVYAVAQLTITDRAAYDRYQAGVPELLRRYGGSLLVSDEAPTVVDGSWEHDKVVVLSFPDRTAFTAFAESDDYQRIAVDRQAGAEGPILLVQGRSR